MSRKKNKKNRSQGIHINKFLLNKQIKGGRVEIIAKVGKKERQKAKGSYVPKGVDRKEKQETIFGVRR